MVELHSLDLLFACRLKINSETFADQSSDGFICDKKGHCGWQIESFHIQWEVGQSGLMVKNEETIHLKSLNVSAVFN